MPRSQDGCYPLAELRQTRRGLALHGQRPAPRAGPQAHKARELLGSRQGQDGLSLRLDRGGFPAVVMQDGRTKPRPARL